MNSEQVNHAAENKNIEKSQNSLAEFQTQLESAVGSANVRPGEKCASLYTDVYRSFEIPLCVVRPPSIEALQKVAALANDAGMYISIRGGGASYTDGYLSKKSAFILLDLTDLNKIEEVNEYDGYVTVESGVTWAQLKQELDQRGLRTPFWGPFSGLHATVGGSMSQNSISHGSGAHGISAQSAISMDVVLADGRILKTGSASAGCKPFLRYFGPDLSGLFTGDCGSLGIKARITLPLIKKREAHRCISFSFNTFENMHESMRRIAMENLEDSHFALDGALSQGQIARQENASEMLKIIWSILSSSPSLFEGVKQLFQSALKAKKEISTSPFMTHYIVEGVNDAEVKARMHRLRQLQIGIGREIPATVPSVVRGMPFAPFYNTLGPKGERWVPIHGILAHSSVNAFHVDLKKLYEKHEEKMQKFGVWHGGMFSAVGNSGFLYEIALYWPDEISAYHTEVIPKDYLDKLPKYPKNLEAREFTDQLKSEIITLLAQHQAVNFQLGKAYPYLNRLTPETKELVENIKNTVDKNRLLSVGCLGFESK